MKIRNLLEQAQNGSSKAIEEIIKSHEALIRKTCSRYYSNILDYDDFLQLARMGIWMAIQTYPLKRYKVKRLSGCLYFEVRIKNDKSIYIVKRLKNRYFFELDYAYEPKHKFIAWVRQCIKHHFAKEIRKETQLCRKVNSMIDASENNYYMDYPSSDNIDIALNRLSTVVDKKLEEDEKICFECECAGKSFNETVEEVQKKYRHFKRDDVKISRIQAATKIREEIALSF